MSRWKPDLTELVIARYTRLPSAEDIERTWKETKRAGELDREFPKRNMELRKVENGFEIFVKRG